MKRRSETGYRSGIRNWVRTGGYSVLAVLLSFFMGVGVIHAAAEQAEAGAAFYEDAKSAYINRLYELWTDGLISDSAITWKLLQLGEMVPGSFEDIEDGYGAKDFEEEMKQLAFHDSYEALERAEDAYYEEGLRISEENWDEALSEAESVLSSVDSGEGAGMLSALLEEDNGSDDILEKASPSDIVLKKSRSRGIVLRKASSSDIVLKKASSNNIEMDEVEDEDEDEEEYVTAELQLASPSEVEKEEDMESQLSTSLFVQSLQNIPFFSLLGEAESESEAELELEAESESKAESKPEDLSKYIASPSNISFQVIRDGKWANLEDSSIQDGQDLRVTIGWTISGDQYKSNKEKNQGASYTYALPSGFKLSQDIETAIREGDINSGREIGTLKISKDGTIQIQYNKDYNENNNTVKSYMFVEGKVELAAGKNEEKLEFPGAEKTITIIPAVPETKKFEVYKGGNFYADGSEKTFIRKENEHGGNHVHWEVRINSDRKKDANFSGLIVEDTPKERVRKGSVVLLEDDVEHKEYQKFISYDGNTIRVVFPDNFGTRSSTWQLWYITDATLVDGMNYETTNTVEVTPKGGETISKTATVEKAAGKGSGTKKFESFDKDETTGEVKITDGKVKANWTVEINYPEEDLGEWVKEYKLDDEVSKQSRVLEGKDERKIEGKHYFLEEDLEESLKSFEAVVDIKKAGGEEKVTLKYEDGEKNKEYQEMVRYLLRKWDWKTGEVGEPKGILQIMIQCPTGAEAIRLHSLKVNLKTVVDVSEVQSGEFWQYENTMKFYEIKGNEDQKTIFRAFAYAKYSNNSRAKKILTKTADTDNVEKNGYVTYSVLINPEAVDLGEKGIKNLEIVDTIESEDYELELMRDEQQRENVHLYRITKENPDGEKIPDEELEISFEKENSEKKSSHTIRIPIQNKTAYRLEYSYRIKSSLKAGIKEGSIGNRVTIGGMFGAETSNTIHYENAGAAAENGSLKLFKVEEGKEMNKLAGAKFQLQKGISDENGRITTYQGVTLSGNRDIVIPEEGFVIDYVKDQIEKNVLYRLQEIEAPAGYDLRKAEDYYFVIRDEEGENKESFGITEVTIHNFAMNKSETVNISNVPLPSFELPETGASGRNRIYGMGMVLLLLCGYGLVEQRRRRVKGEIS